MKENDVDKNLFIVRINELRRSLDTSAADMADGICSSSAMNYYLNGKRHPDSETIYRICSKYNCSADWLLGLTDIRSPDNDVQVAVNALGISEKFIEKQKNLDDDSRMALYRLLVTEGFMEAVLVDYMDYETAKEALNKLLTTKQDTEDKFPEYDPHIENGCIVLPPNDAADYYAKRVGSRLAGILNMETTELLIKMGYEPEDI